MLHISLLPSPKDLVPQKHGGRINDPSFDKRVIQFSFLKAQTENNYLININIKNCWDCWDRKFPETHILLR